MEPHAGFYTTSRDVTPSLGIVGGAETREEAEKRVADAVAFTLDAEEDGSAQAETEVRYLNVEIAAG